METDILYELTVSIIPKPSSVWLSPIETQILFCVKFTTSQSKAYFATKIAALY